MKWESSLGCRAHFMGRNDFMNFLCIGKRGRVRTVKWEPRRVKHCSFRTVYCDVISIRVQHTFIKQLWLLLLSNHDCMMIFLKFPLSHPLGGGDWGSSSERTIVFSLTLNFFCICYRVPKGPLWIFRCQLIQVGILARPFATWQTWRSYLILSGYYFPFFEYLHHLLLWTLIELTLKFVKSVALCLRHSTF